MDLPHRQLGQGGMTSSKLTEAFTAETGTSRSSVEYLAYADGDDKVNSAITAKGAPDLSSWRAPERLVANWGANGYMVDLTDMLDDTDKAEINAVNPGTLVGLHQQPTAPSMSILWS